MQSVDIGWTAEERDTVRSIAHNLLVSWHKDSLLTGRTFTIGVSEIGGNDVVGANAGVIGSPGFYRYFDESDYVTGLSWERSLQTPLGGLTIALAEAELDNTSDRFTPSFMGGISEVSTAILPSRPAIINAGFKYGGIDHVIPQFSGTVHKQPKIDIRSGDVTLSMADYAEFFRKRYLDRTAVFTSVSTDVIMETFLQRNGMNTSQYDLDPGINVIPFALFDRGSRLEDIFNKLSQAENGYFFQDEQGVFKFWNRQHWDSTPYTDIQRIILTGQVINAEAPNDDHLINTVEIKSKVRSKAINQKLWALSSPTLVPANSSIEIFADFTDDDGALPVLEVDTPEYAVGGAVTSAFATNIRSDNTGSTNAGAVYLKSFDQFATSYKMTFKNNSNQNTYITALQLWGRPAKVTSEVYTRKQRDASVTAFEERPITIENNFIQSQDWADTFAEVLLEDYAFMENLQTIEIRALPELQLGDLVSWQGRWWRVFSIKSKLNPGDGFIQELKLLQREVRSYFRIGISEIGGTDKIAP